MTRGQKLSVGAGAVALGLIALAVLLVSAALMLIPDERELARRASAALSAASGLPVRVAAVRWHLLPVPRVVVEGLATDQPRPVTLSRLTLYPRLGTLVRGRLQFERAVVDGAVLPQPSVRALGDSARAADAPASTRGPPLHALPVQRLEFRDVSWISQSGVAVQVEGEADFDAGWLPRSASVRRPGVTPPADLSVTRQPQGGRWKVLINVGGGTAHGEAQLQTLAGGQLRLGGTLHPDGIDTARAATAFNRKPALGGSASGTTTLASDGATPGDLARSLHTRSLLRVSRARLLGFDLESAVRSAGRNHSGQTALDSLTGQLDTQNTADGLVIDFSNIRASSGVLTATGKGRLLNQRVQAELAVDLVEGVVGVPLTVSGPVGKVTVSVPASAVAGAAVGTAVLPGVGTAIGARIGATLGKIFGSEPSSKTPSRTPPKTLQKAP